MKTKQKLSDKKIPCPKCNGTGSLGGGLICGNCNGTGEVTILHG